MEQLEALLDRFVDGLFRLMLEHHQKHALEIEVTLPQAQALRLLREQSVPTSRMAAELGISAPAATQMTDRLVRKQLIERRADEADRRSVVVGLTAKGRRAVDGFRQRRNEIFGETISRLSDDDRLDVIRALGKIAEVLDGHDPAAAHRPTSRAVKRTDRQTAQQPAEASKIAGEIPMDRPARRMKIEWD